MMKKFLFAALLAIALSSCTNTVRKEGTEDAIFSVDENDAEMNEAMRQANATIGNFKRERF